MTQTLTSRSQNCKPSHDSNPHITQPKLQTIAKILRNLAKEVEAGKFGDTGCCMNKNSRHVDAELAEKIKSAAS